MLSGVSKVTRETDNSYKENIGFGVVLRLNKSMALDQTAVTLRAQWGVFDSSVQHLDHARQ